MNRVLRGVRLFVFQFVIFGFVLHWSRDFWAYNLPANAIGITWLTIYPEHWRWASMRRLSAKYGQDRGVLRWIQIYAGLGCAAIFVTTASAFIDAGFSHAVTATTFIVMCCFCCADYMDDDDDALRGWRAGVTSAYERMMAKYTQVYPPATHGEPA